MIKRASLLAVAVFAGWSQIASGTVILDYVGNPFTDFFQDGPTTPAETYQVGDKVTGWIELSDALAPNLEDQFIFPLTYRFMDGVNTIDNTSATDAFFQFSTNSSGLITKWNASVSIFMPTVGGGVSKGISTVDRDDIFDPIAYDGGADALCGPDSIVNSCAIYGDPFYSQFAQAGGNPGIWSYRAVEVPVPATLALFGLGLAGLGWSRRKRE